MQRKRFILRNESFGFTVYDRKTLTHRFAAAEELGGLLEGSDAELLEVDLSGAPSDILAAPIRIYYEATKKCNLRCRPCFNSSGLGSPDEMSLEESLKSIEGLRKDGVIDLRFTGGEFTQKDGWLEILKRSMDLGFVTSLNTNGVYESPDTVGKLSSLGLDQVTISIDGAREHHDYLRGRGSFDKAVASLKALKESGAIARVNTILTKKVLADYRNILDVAAATADEINFFYMRTVGRGKGIEHMALTPEELHRFDLAVEEAKKDYPGLRILHGSQVMLRTSISDKSYGLRMGGPDGFTRMNMLDDGQIYAGGYAPYIGPDLSLGNIRKEGYTMLGIWRGSAKLERFREQSLALQGACGACEEKTGGVCPGASMEMVLAAGTDNPYCARAENLSDVAQDVRNAF